MIPTLFDKNQTEFNTNGVGKLIDTISCIVTEERNGEFELEAQYPITGEHYSAITLLSIILAAPGDGRADEPFRIYKISKPMNGIITINAQHISYQLSHIPCLPFSANSAASALTGLKANAAENCPFDFWTDKNTVASYNQTIPESIRARLGGTGGSILDAYGGEYEFSGYTVKLHNARGNDNGVELRYGKNITDIKQEENISSTITGICPFWLGNENKIVTLPEKTVYSENAKNYPYPRTVCLDMSSDFEKEPTVEHLRAASLTYITKNSFGIPKVSIAVSFAPLWQTEEYKNIASLERVKLCDIVTVIFEKLGISAKAKVVKTEYNVLLDRYKKLELGECKTSLANTIINTEQTLKDKTSDSYLSAAANKATSWITGTNGGFVVINKDANGQPYEILIMDKPDIFTAKKVWRWNQNGLGYSSTGYNGKYGLAMTQDGAIVADFITAGTLSANLIKSGLIESKNGETKINLETGEANITGSLSTIKTDILSRIYECKLTPTGLEFFKDGAEYGGIEIFDTTGKLLVNAEYIKCKSINFIQDKTGKNIGSITSFGEMSWAMLGKINTVVLNDKKISWTFDDNLKAYVLTGN